MQLLPASLRVLIKILLSIVLLCVVLVAGFAAWLYFYTSDLPHSSDLAVYMADGGGVVLVPTKFCGESVMVAAIPGVNMPELRQAVLAAEGDFDPRSFFWRYYGAIDRTPRYGHYSDQLARQMVCGSKSHNLKRTLTEVRTALQLERRFTQDQLLDIYLNRAYFGPGIYGATEAARRYFGKSAADLTIAESALLAGLITHPAYYSPIQHPDRAIARRNDVIDAMLLRGSIKPGEATAAKLAPLGIAPQ
jgi:hypothetical protein